jgi:hypothetical protein
MNERSIPVLLVSFNRPELTKKALDNLKLIEPPVIFFSVDGPRINNVKDKIKVLECRALANEISWDCKIYVNFSDSNLGCGPWMVNSINWAFQYVSELLILEDDVEISKEFYNSASHFVLSEEKNESIFAICASNLSFERKIHSNRDYFKSVYFAGWGWATWKSRWNAYDYEIIRNRKIDFLKLLKVNNFNPFIVLYFLLNFFLIRINKLSAWDYQVNYLMFLNNLYVVKPYRNLSRNFGDGDSATHTKFMPTFNIQEQQKDVRIVYDLEFDNSMDQIWRKSRILFLFKSFLKRYIG